MGFEWDTDKEARNIAKHGVDFVQASRIFRKPVLERADTRKDYGEERVVALGQYDGVVLCVVYTRRNRNRRIISAWKAGGDDKKAYEDACGQI